ncbi:MAG: hypothetical protein JXA52_02900 [Planctomycetes bacterium]|nr:hypothetical protein [Planctomycetota bacterium]
MISVLRRTGIIARLTIALTILVCAFTISPAMAIENLDNLGYKFVYSYDAPPDSAFERNGPWYEWIELLQPTDSFLSNKVNTADDRVHVYLGEFLTHNDNLFLNEKDEDSDIIETRTAGLDIRSERFEESGENKYYAEILAEFRYEDYLDYDEEDHSEFDIVPKAEYKFNELFKLEYEGSYRRSQSSTDRTFADSILHYRMDSILNLAVTPSDKWGFDLAGLVRDKYYPVTIDQQHEAREYATTLAPYYQMSENLQIGFDATYGEIYYDHAIQNEVDYSEARFTTSYVYENWSFYLAAGWQLRDYDTSGTDVDRGDYSGFTYNGSIRYTDPDYKWDVGLRAARMPTETSAGNFSEFTRVSVDASYIPIDPLRLRAEVFAEYSNQSNYWDSNRNGVSTSISWSFCDYAGTGVSYQHVRNLSDAPDSDYINNLLSVGLWFTF